MWLPVDQARAIAALLDHLDLRDCAIVGHSMGDHPGGASPGTYIAAGRCRGQSGSWEWTHASTILEFMLSYDKLVGNFIIGQTRRF